VLGWQSCSGRAKMCLRITPHCARCTPRASVIVQGTQDGPVASGICMTPSRDVLKPSAIQSSFDKYQVRQIWNEVDGALPA
jgi:hypothetical protein